MVGDIPANINEALDDFFGKETSFYETLRVIAEPGRYFAEASMHLCCHVHSVRNRDDFCDYLISDGLYGSFNCVVYDGAKPRADAFIHAFIHSHYLPTTISTIQYLLEQANKYDFELPLLPHKNYLQRNLRTARRKWALLAIIRAAASLSAAPSWPDRPPLCSSVVVLDTLALPSRRSNLFAWAACSTSARAAVR